MENPHSGAYIWVKIPSMNVLGWNNVTFTWKNCLIWCLRSCWEHINTLYGCINNF